jgi:hypothetical protein
MARPETLAAIQRWMQAVIRQPDGDGAAWIDAVVQPSQALSSRDRLLIYANAYFARLLEVMSGEYPAVRHAVGADVFAEFVFGFLQRHPSTSYTLSQLGAKFPADLAETRPPRDGDGPDWIDFLIETATLERTYAEVFDGPGIEDRPAFDPTGLSPDDWPKCRLTFAPCVRRVRLQFPVHDYITAVRRSQEPSPPSPQPTNLVVTRRDYIVRRVAMLDEEFRLFSLLAEGRTVGEALEHWFAEDPQATPPIQEWFERWTQAGYFTRVE